MIKFAIYGCGTISRIHAAALRDVEGAELVACADLKLAAAETFARARGIRVIPDWDALLCDEEVDGVCVCTPSGTHAQLAIEALKAGKHVVLEKPMAITAADCDRIIAAAEESTAKIMVISQMRTAPDVCRVKALLEEGAFGRLVMCQLHMCYYRPAEYYQGSWRGTKAMDGGGALMNQGIHGVDILQHLAGPVKQLRSVVRTLLHDIEVEDTAVAALEFESGAVGVITASTATYPGFDREVRLYGTRGAAVIKDEKLVRLILDGKEESCEAYTSRGTAGTNLLSTHQGHARQLDAFVRALRGEPVGYMDQYQGKQGVDLIEWIYRESM